MSLWEIYRVDQPDTRYSVLALNPEAAVRAARMERFGFAIRELRWACRGDDWRTA